jgi:hypothetical protein
VQVVKVLLIASLGLLVGTAGLSAYLLFFLAPDEPVSEPPYPGPGAVVQARAQEFRWPDDGAPRWEFRLLDAQGKVLFRTRRSVNRLVLPPTLLSPNGHFSWLLFRTDEGGEPEEVPVVNHRFRTAEELSTPTFWSPLTLFPARLVIGPDQMVRDMSLEISHRGLFRVRLPAELVFPDGTKDYDSSGDELLRFRWDHVNAHDEPEDWGSIRVWAGLFPAKIPLVPEGPLESVHGTSIGFDPYRATPSFANFSTSLLSKLTQGTCVGIALVVKLVFERVSFGAKAPGVAVDSISSVKFLEALLTSSRLVIRSSLDLRELSLKQTDLVMGLMSALHYENLDVRNIRETLATVLFDGWRENTRQYIWHELRNGRPPVVAAFRLRRKVARLPRDLLSLTMFDSGHAFLIYRGWRFEGASVFSVYDPNYEYREEHPLKTALVFKGGWDPIYYVNSEPERLLVRFLPFRSSKLAELMGIAALDAREKGKELVEKALDAIRLFEER